MWHEMRDIPKRSGTYLVTNGVNYAILNFTVMKDWDPNFNCLETFGWHPAVSFLPTNWMELPKLNQG